MKHLTTYLFLLALVSVSLQTVSANSQGETDISKDIVLKINQGPKILRVLPTHEIKPGESEVQKREKLAAKSNSSRTLTAREKAETEEVAVMEQSSDYSYEDLRNLYMSAAAKYSIDWKLIEAVHQVESGKSAGTCKQSYAGATGPMQFLPSTFRHYANEGDNICSVKDSVYAAANLLASSGADVGDIDSALFNYNHSRSYVELVKSVMNSIK